MSDSPRPVALLVVHTNSYFANLLPIARLLARSGRYEPRFWFANSYPTLARDQVACREAGIAFEIANIPGPPSRLHTALNLVRHSSVAAPVRLAATLRKVRTLLQRLHVELVILPADNRYDLAAYIKAAHDEGIPAVVVPAFMAAATEWAQAVRGDPAYALRRALNRLAAALHPRWALEHEGEHLVAAPGPELLAREWLGLAPPSPWTLHSGHADAIAVESEAMRSYCLLEGLPPRQLILTGSLDHDQMYARTQDAAGLRESLLGRLGLRTGKPLIVTALPPDQLYGRGRPQCDFQDYRELVQFWIESLTADGAFNVVVSLHPSVQRETMTYVEDWGARVADESVSALIPLCDVYVASVSATIQWAIACGIPVLNYDVYRYRYPDYLGVPGVVLTEEQHEFRACISQLADAAYRDELRAKQGEAARYWGLLDGKAGDRLLALFSELASARR